MKCEFCGADKMDEAPDGATGFFACGTIIWENKHPREGQTIICNIDEVKRLKSHIARLEKAGDAAVANSYDGPVPIYVRQAWTKAKEAKP